MLLARGLSVKRAGSPARRAIATKGSHCCGGVWPCRKSPAKILTAERAVQFSVRHGWKRSCPGHHPGTAGDAICALVRHPRGGENISKPSAICKWGRTKKPLCQVTELKNPVSVRSWASGIWGFYADFHRPAGRGLQASGQCEALWATQNTGAGDCSCRHHQLFRESREPGEFTWRPR